MIAIARRAFILSKLVFSPQGVGTRHLSIIGGRDGLGSDRCGGVGGVVNPNPRRRYEEDLKGFEVPGGSLPDSSISDKDTLAPKKGDDIKGFPDLPGTSTEHSQHDK